MNYLFLIGELDTVYNEQNRKRGMSNIKNKDTLYLVVRSDEEDDSKVVCAITRTEERAHELCGQYLQEMLDRNILWYGFYVQGQTYYDE